MLEGVLIECGMIVSFEYGYICIGRSSFSLCGGEELSNTHPTIISCKDLILF